MYPAMWCENRDIYWRRYKKHCTWDNDTSVPFKVGTLRPHTVLLIAISCPLYFHESHWWSEISSISKVILVLGKSRRRRTPNLVCRGLSHLGDLMFCQKTLHEMWCMSRCAVMMKLPITSCPQLRGLLNHADSFHGGMFKLNPKIWCRFVVLLTQLECNNHTEHVLTQWCLPPSLTSTGKSSLFMHVHSSPLSLAAR